MKNLIFLLICCIIPITYLIAFKCYKSKKKNYIRALFISLIMFITLYSTKIIVKIDNSIFYKANCLINNICRESTMNANKLIEENNNIEIGTTTTTSTTTVTTTTTSTTTTSKVIDKNSNYNYKKIEEPIGEKIEIGTSKNGKKIYTINGVPYIDGYLIVNKTYTVDEKFVPTNTYKEASATSTSQCSECIDKTAYKAWKDMKSDAQALGLNIYISSGYRSYVTQRNIYNRNVNKNGQEKADTYSARPGSSEHQTGLCFDLNTINAAFAKTAEGKWVNDNCWKYGYIIRYPEGKTEYTGYIYESWHLRYVGSDLAKELYNNGDWLTMEEYFGITSSYTN